MKPVGLTLILILLAGCTGGSNTIIEVDDPVMDAPRGAPSVETFSGNPNDYVFSVVEFYHSLSSGVQDGYTITGEVGEVTHTDRYTYLRLVEGKEELWVATSKAEISEGASVMVTGSAYFDFPSTSMNKTFSVLILAPTYSIIKDGEVISGTSDAPSMGMGPHG